MYIKNMESSALFTCVLFVMFCCPCLCTFYPDTLCIDYEGDFIFPGDVYYDGCNHCVCGIFGRAERCTQYMGGPFMRDKPSLPMYMSTHRGHRPVRLPPVPGHWFRKSTGMPPAKPRFVPMMENPMFIKKGKITAGQRMDPSLHKGYINRRGGSSSMYPHVMDHSLKLKYGDQYPTPAANIGKIIPPKKDRGLTQPIKDQTFNPVVEGGHSFSPILMNQNKSPVIWSLRVVPPIKDRKLIPKIREGSMIPDMTDQRVIVTPSTSSAEEIKSFGDPTTINFDRVLGDTLKPTLSTSPVAEALQLQPKSARKLIKRVGISPRIM